MKRILSLRAAMLALSMACCQALAWVVVTAPPAAAQIELDLRDADLRSFVEIVSEATNRSFVLDPNVRGTVTVLAPDTLTPAELYDVFLNVLELNRLTIVQGSSVDRIVPMNVARELSSGPARTAPKGFETRVIEVNNVPLTEIIEVIRPLLPAEAVLSPVPGSNLLILSDRGQNHARIEALIRRLDTPRERPIEMVRLRNADAAEVLQVIQSMQIVPDDAAVSIDRRSNALIVSGSDSLVQQVRTLASRLDTQNANVASRAVELNYADATRLADVVTRAITNEQRVETDAAVRIIAETQTNTLLITAPPEQMGDIIEMVHFLDRRPTQVLVEAVIFEMSVIGFADLSAQFGAILNDAIIGGVEFTLDGRPSLTSLVSSVLNNTTNTVPTPGNGGYFGVGARNSSGEGIVGLLGAIASTNSTRLLSTPSIMTLNNQEAEIVVAQNVPFVTGSFAQVGETAQPDNPFQTIERQDVGLTLKVTPQINADRTVRMEIEQEVSNLTNSKSSAGGEITARRALSTTVLVRDGNVIMLGGLLENGSGSVSQRVPGLSKLPLVGGLFRGKNANKNQRVLLVMLRPRVVKDDHEARKITTAIAREAKNATLALQPPDDGQYPKTPSGTLPFDGVDLNQPFDAGFVDDFAQNRNYPPLPTRLRFKGGRD
ncbi:type II secretion system protein GspD [Sulfitobacter sp. G21635-S1]|uniref:secretin N-terminal domain-containing protein n=1 Tax=Sulfitobacter sp. G21635-S1 TaxID=3014043 RepID=UPI0022B02C8B|nr:secretin N-terminal domain-containing protein [Sulfitobacter sp. G21635-S1]MCZ4255414.1 type II secretion system protein GspD [Sulfitobacter sp. G21635-S1]